MNIHYKNDNVKFIFPNEYSVYLHDTPSKKLFQLENALQKITQQQETFIHLEQLIVACQQQQIQIKQQILIDNLII